MFTKQNGKIVIAIAIHILLFTYINMYTPPISPKNPHYKRCITWGEIEGGIFVGPNKICLEHEK